MSQLVLLHLRRDRWKLLAWVLFVGLLPALIAVSTRQGYPDQAAMNGFAQQSMANASELALRGPIFAVTVGGLVAWTVASSGSLVSAVVAILFATRYIRADEAAGRTELLRAQPVRRSDLLAAALAVPCGCGVAIGAVAFAGLVATGLPLGGSLLLGLVLMGSTLLFAALGAVTAQLSSSPGAARGFGFVALGVLFVIAAAGDATHGALVWFSPFGWARYAQAFAANLFWVPVLPLGGTLLLAVLAIRLDAARDLGAGLVPNRPGRATAPSWLSGPFSLSWRLSRGVLLSWSIGLGLLGVLMGSTMSNLDAQLDSTAFHDFAARHGGGSVGEVFFLFVLYVLAQVATAAALASILSLRTDETDRLAELLLAQPVTRSRWVLSRLLIAAGVGGGILAAIAVGAALTSGKPGLAFLTLAYLPPVLLMIGLAVALFGWVPRTAVAASWSILGLLLLADLLGEFALVPPAVVAAISPYAATFGAVVGSGLPLLAVGLTVGAAGLAALGMVGLRRRDLALG